MPQNRLLAALPAEERARLAPYLETVALDRGQLLVETDRSIEHVYLLHDVITSTIVRQSEGSMIEVGLMGAEGFVGLSLLLGTERSNADVVVQIPGRASRMRAEDFRRHVMDAGGAAYKLLLRYVDAFMAMIAQTAGCNALHKIDERMCRWVLLTHDRVGRDEFPLTHEYLSMMLGVRRSSITNVAHELKEAGAIDYQRGNVRVLDRQRLEAGSCACYRTIKRDMDKLFDGDGR